MKVGIPTSPGAEAYRLSLVMGTAVELITARLTRKPYSIRTRVLSPRSLYFHVGRLPVQKFKISDPVV